MRERTKKRGGGGGRLEVQFGVGSAKFMTEGGQQWKIRQSRKCGTPEQSKKIKAQDSRNDRGGGCASRANGVAKKNIMFYLPSNQKEPRKVCATPQNTGHTSLPDSPV